MKLNDWTSSLWLPRIKCPGKFADFKTLVRYYRSNHKYETGHYLKKYEGTNGKEPNFDKEFQWKRR